MGIIPSTHDIDITRRMAQMRTLLAGARAKGVRRVIQNDIKELHLRTHRLPLGMMTDTQIRDSTAKMRARH